MDEKFKKFLEIAQNLNRYGVIPTLYGSIGVSRFIKVDDIDDIDIIISDNYLNGKFKELIKIMEEIGYQRDKKFPHEFIKGKIRIGFEPESELTKSINKNPSEFKQTEVEGVKFRELSPEDYLILYKKCLSFREKRINKMKDKIRALEDLLQI